MQRPSRMSCWQAPLSKRAFTKADLLIFRHNRHRVNREKIGGCASFSYECASMGSAQEVSNDISRMFPIAPDFPCKVKNPLPRRSDGATKKKVVGCALASPIGSDLELPELNQLDNRLRTAFDVQLLHHIRDMVANRFLADEQLLGNVAGRFVLHKQFENFTFPIGQKEFAFMIAAFQRVSPLLAREWNDYKV